MEKINSLKNKVKRSFFLITILVLLISFSLVSSKVMVISDNCYLDCKNKDIPSKPSEDYETSCNLEISKSRDFGIYITGRKNIEIKNCRIGYYWAGLYLNDSLFIKITNNEIFTNNWAGIFLYNSNSNHIEKNSIYDNMYYGIYLDSSSFNYIRENRFEKNGKSAIFLYNNSNSNSIEKNKIFSSEQGITASSCYQSTCSAGNSNNRIKNNKIKNNSIGIFAKESDLFLSKNDMENMKDIDVDYPKNISSPSKTNHILVLVSLTVLFIILTAIILRKRKKSKGKIKKNEGGENEKRLFF